jgi:branched-chain amino acid transport system substrate-binding protein
VSKGVNPELIRRYEMKKKGSLIKRQILIMLLASIVLTVFTSGSMAAEKKPIKFGCVYGLSGGGALMGKSAADAIKMAVEEINAAGGVLGRKLQGIYRDGGQDPEKTLRECKSLVFDEDVLWLQVGVGTAVGIQASQFAGQYGESEKFIVLPIAQGLSITTTDFNPYVFRLFSTALTGGRALAAGVKERWNAKKLVSISADYSYGHDAVNSFQEEYKKVMPDAKFYDTVWYPHGSTDFTPYVSRIMALDAEVVYNSAWGGDYVAFVKQAAPYGYYKKFHECGCDIGNVSSIGHLRRGDPYPKGALSLNFCPVWELDNPMAKHYFSKFLKKYNYYSDFTGNVNYGYTHVMAKAINSIGSTDIDKIIAYLEGRVIDVACGSFEIRTYDHQLLIPQWSGTIEFTEGMPHPHVTDIWRPEDPTALYYSVEEIKEMRTKANSPYVNYSGK